MKLLSPRIFAYAFCILLGLLSALPNVLPTSISKELPSWYANNTLTLGLDLRGGSHLLLEMDTKALFRGQNEQMAEQFSEWLRAQNLQHQPPIASEDSIKISPLHPGDANKMLGVLRKALAASSGGESYTTKERKGQLYASLSEDTKKTLTAEALEQSLEVVRRRLDESGLVEPSITRQGNNALLIQLPGVDDPKAIRSILGTTAKMSFHWVARDLVTKSTVLVVKGNAGESYTLERRIALEGEHIKDARLGFSPNTKEPVVTFKLDSEGARRFGDMTRSNIGRPLAIVLDAYVITAPVIRSVIDGGSGEISGNFTVAEAADLALLLRAGALPAPLKVIEERTVGPDLGSDSITMGLTTGLLGAALVIGFMVVLYGTWGVIACLGLAINIALVFGILSLLGATLTLPGIAGIILTIGMAVDANILINERIREESRKGASPWGALNTGFKRAYSTILDSNATTLIAVSLLFLFGSGPVRGFAVTIGIGLLTSLFTTIAVTRFLMDWRVRKMGRRPLTISGVKFFDGLGEHTIPFMRGRVAGLIASAVLSLAAILLWFEPGLKYGIDFTGGTVVEVRAPGTDVSGLRDNLAASGLKDALIQEFGEAERYLVRLPMEEGGQGAEDVASGQPVEKLKQAVLEHAPAAEFPRVEMVGPKVSGDFADATIFAIILAGAGMLGYLWFRFESHFAMAAIITIALDLTKTIGFFVLAGVEFNLTAVAALLALIGYSINDKVVVFDRVRENLRLTPDKALVQVLNESITSTLTRTVFTSFTTFLALLPMAIAGGAGIASFVLPMLFGIVVGTSSSIFIAAPIVLKLGQKRIKNGLAQLRPTREEMMLELEKMP